MTKAELRLHYRTLRLQLSPNEMEERSREIIERLLSQIQLNEKIVSLFLPIERQREINTYILLDRAKNVGATVAVPKSNFQSMEMKHYIFESTTQLEMNDHGIPEPKAGKVIAAERFDIVFVPLLAVDIHGNRVGYGKGFYDRFLNKCKPTCQFIGLHYFDTEDFIEDVLPTDVKLNLLVTPSKIIRF